MKLRAGAVAALLAASLVGCGDDEPTPPPDSSTMSGLATPTTPTDEPSETEPDKQMGPVATVRAWVKARNVTVQTGDAEAVYALSSKDCKTCRDWVEPIVEIYDNGGRFDTHGWRVLTAKKGPSFGESHEVGAHLKVTAGRTWASEGADPVEYDADQKLGVFELVKEGDRWLVGAIYFPS